MRWGPHSIRSDNLVVKAVRLWSAQKRPVSDADWRRIRIGVQRDGDAAWLAEWDQRTSALQANESVLLTGQNDLNYALRVDDVVIAEEESGGTPVAPLRGLVAEVQLSRVGEVGELAEERPGTPGGYATVRPLISNPRPGDRDLELIVRQLNESGLPDLSLPVYFYD